MTVKNTNLTNSKKQVDTLYYTTYEVASLLKLHYETVRGYIKRGKLKALKFPSGRGEYRISKTDLEEFLGGMQ